MRYLKIGYITVFLSLLLAVIVFFIIYWFLRFYDNYDWLFPIMIQTEANISIIGVQMFGLVLCLLGMKKGERISFNLTALASDIFLILFGAFVIWWSLGWYGELLTPTIWDQMEYATFVITGLLWVASSIIFIATSYMKKVRNQSENDFSHTLK
jgi:hypothetical protein